MLSENVVVKTRKGTPLQRRFEKMLKSAYHGRVFICHKCECVASFTNSSGAADAMNIGVRTVGHIVVDDV